jgi:hypothetical protein
MLMYCSKTTGSLALCLGHPDERHAVEMDRQVAICGHYLEYFGRRPVVFQKFTLFPYYDADAGEQRPTS